MVYCYILRKSKTLKIVKKKDEINSFTFERGKYYLNEDKIFLRKRGILIKRYVPCLFYIEGISEPLALNNIQKRKVPKVDETGQIETDKDGNTIMVDDETVLINAFNIHDMTSSDMLSVLTSTNMTKTDKLFIGLLILNLLVTIAGLF